MLKVNYQLVKRITAGILFLHNSLSVFPIVLYCYRNLMAKPPNLRTGKDPRDWLQPSHFLKEEIQIQKIKLLLQSYIVSVTGS